MRKRKGRRKVRELGGWKEESKWYLLNKEFWEECGTFAKGEERCAWRYGQTNLTGGEGKKRTDT